MKKLLSLLLMVAAFLTAHAQETTSVKMTSEKSIVKLISQKMDVNDKVFVINSTPYTLMNTEILIYKTDGEYQTICNISDTKSGQKIEAASFEDNNLRIVKGKPLIVRVKILKEGKLAENSKFGDEDVLIAVLYEEDHDLYVELVNSEDYKNNPYITEEGADQLRKDLKAQGKKR